MVYSGNQSQLSTVQSIFIKIAIKNTVDAIKLQVSTRYFR